MRTVGEDEEVEKDEEVEEDEVSDCHWHNRSVCCTIKDMSPYISYFCRVFFSWPEQSSNHLSLFP